MELLQIKPIMLWIILSSSLLNPPDSWDCNFPASLLYFLLSRSSSQLYNFTQLVVTLPELSQLQYLQFLLTTDPGLHSCAAFLLCASTAFEARKALMSNERRKNDRIISVWFSEWTLDSDSFLIYWLKLSKWHREIVNKLRVIRLSIQCQCQ